MHLINFFNYFFNWFSSNFSFNIFFKFWFTDWFKKTSYFRLWFLFNFFYYFWFNFLITSSTTFSTTWDFLVLAFALCSLFFCACCFKYSFSPNSSLNFSLYNFLRSASFSYFFVGVCFARTLYIIFRYFFLNTFLRRFLS